MMKIYKFYCKSSKISGFNDDKYTIYAITCKKSLAKEFKRTRNIDDCFKIIVEDCVDDSEWETLSREFPTHVLQKYYLTGFKDKNVMKPTLVEFVLTLEEKMTIEDASESFLSLFPTTLVNPMIFNKEIRKILHKLKYMEFYRVMSSSVPLDDDDVALRMIDREYPGESYDYPSVDIDEVELFIDIYEKILNLGD